MNARREGLVSLAMFAAACAAGCSGAAPETAPHVDALPTLGYVEELRIGSVDDPDLGFSRISRVRVSDRGEVYVMDSPASQIKVFSANGERLRTIGRSGDGPGEFASPANMGFLGDTLWVTDARTRRITWFGSDGSVLFTTTSPGVPFDVGLRGVGLTLVPMRPRPDGLIESELFIVVNASAGREIRPYRYPVLAFDRAGAVVDTVRWETADEDAASFRIGDRQGYAPALTPSPPVRAEMAGDRVSLSWRLSEDGRDGLLEITRSRPDGAAVYASTLRFAPVPVPAEILDSLIQPRLRGASLMNATEAQMEEALRAAVRLPEVRPPIRSVHGGADGTLWIQLNTPDPDLVHWVLLDGDGSPVGRLTLPMGVQIHHSNLPTAWVVQPDEFEVPWLLRLRVETMP